MFKELRTKIRIFKKVLELKKEFKRRKRKQKTFDEVKHFLETAKLLYPKLGGLLEDIIGVAKRGDSNKKSLRLLGKGVLRGLYAPFFQPLLLY